MSPIYFSPANRAPIGLEKEAKFSAKIYDYYEVNFTIVLTLLKFDFLPVVENRTGAAKHCR